MVNKNDRLRIEIEDVNDEDEEFVESWIDDLPLGLGWIILILCSCILVTSLICIVTSMNCQVK